jgi:hypothetical protein
MSGRASLFKLLTPSQAARVVFINPHAMEQRGGYVRSFRGYSSVTAPADLVRADRVIRASAPLAWRLKTLPGHGDTN